MNNNSGTMLSNNEKIIENLKKFGLTDYEAKAYAALASLGISSVTEVSQLCDVPRSNLYAVLEKLSSIGFVEIQKGRPILFKARHPREVLEETEKQKVRELSDARKFLTKELEKTINKQKTNAEPTLVWGVRGHEAIMTKIGEMIKRAKSEFTLNIPNLEWLETNYILLEEAKKRGVKIRIITENKGEISRFQKIGIVRTRDKILGIDVLSDEREMLIGPSPPLVAAWLDNSEMALHVKDFLGLVWKDSKVMK
jgi:sugar-specific transcriptional regulator TrmB